MSTSEVTIETQPVSIDRTEARERVGKPSRTGSRIKHALANVSVSSLELGYKPFFRFDTALHREDRLRGEDTKQGAILVDAVTGIARARPEGYASTEPVSVPETSLVARELDEAEALEEARSFSVKVEHREHRRAELAETGDLVYKPVWIASLDSGNRCVVDATTGEVFSDVSLWQAVPFASKLVGE